MVTAKVSKPAPSVAARDRERVEVGVIVDGCALLDREQTDRCAGPRLQAPAEIDLAAETDADRRAYVRPCTTVGAEGKRGVLVPVEADLQMDRRAVKRNRGNGC